MQVEIRTDLVDVAHCYAFMLYYTQGGERMKKVNILQLIASICLLLGSVINLIEAITETQFPLSVFSIPLLFVAIVLYSVVLGKRKEDKKKNCEE